MNVRVQTKFDCGRIKSKETIRKNCARKREGTYFSLKWKNERLHVVMKRLVLKQLTSREETSPRNIVATVKYRLEKKQKINSRTKRWFDEKGKEQTRIEDRKPQGDFYDQRVWTLIRAWHFNHRLTEHIRPREIRDRHVFVLFRPCIHKRSVAWHEKMQLFRNVIHERVQR